MKTSVKKSIGFLILFLIFLGITIILPGIVYGFRIAFMMFGLAVIITALIKFAMNLINSK